MTYIEEGNIRVAVSDNTDWRKNRVMFVKIYGPQDNDLLVDIFYCWIHVCEKKALIIKFPALLWMLYRRQGFFFTTLEVEVNVNRETIRSSVRKYLCKLLTSCKFRIFMNRRRG